MRRTKKTKKTRMQGHMAVAISMAMAAGLALTGCGSTGTTGVSAETSAGGKNEAGRNTAGNTAGGQEESQSGAGAAQVTDTKKGGKDGGTSLIFTTGGDQGTYYGFGGVLAGKIGESTSTSVTATHRAVRRQISRRWMHMMRIWDLCSRMSWHMPTMVRISLKNMEKLLISRPWRRSIWSRCRLLRWIRRFSR